MEKGNINWNNIIGGALLVLIFIGYSWFSAPDADALEKEAQTADTVQVAEATEKLVETQDSVIPTETLKQVEQYVGPFVQGSQTGEETFTIANEILELSFSTKGAQLVAARLKNYQTWDTLPLYLVNKSAAHNLNLQAEGKEYNSSDLVFVPNQKSDKAISFSVKTVEGGVLSYNYSLEPNNYMLNWNITSSGLGDMLTDKSNLVWKMSTFRHEKNLETERQKTGIEYYEAEDEDLESLSVTGEEEEEATQVKWIGFKQQFFSTILLNKAANFKNIKVYSSNRPESDSTITKDFVSSVSLATSGADMNTNLGVYLGPNKYEVMEAYGYEFEKLIPLGWGILGWINRGIVINIFNWLEGYGLSYGLIILVIALFIKIILFPLTFTSYKSMAKMRVLKPEIEALNEKYKDKDAMAKQQASMELYRKAGVNPLGGCIPVVLQMPILIALFNFFPSSIELRQQSFLWASDLSTYDSILNLPFSIPFYGDHVSLFTLLMTVSTLLYTWMNQQVTGQNQQFPQMKYIVYLMPLIFLGVFNNYAAGLSYYYFLANMITFGQQFAIRAYVNDDKIHAKMQEKKKAPQKENRLMRRMRELQEQQQNQGKRK